MEPQPQPQGPPDSVQAAATALPSRRHAEMLFDAVTNQLGDHGWHETNNGGAIRRLYRSDPTEPDWLVPWPLLELKTGGRFAVVMPWIQVGGTAVEPPTPPRPKPPKLRGLGPGEIRIIDGPDYIELVYNDEGAKYETCRSGSNPLAGLAVALAETSANPIELLARFITRLDPGRHGPARVHLPAPFPHGAAGVWHWGRLAVRRALFEDRVPRGSSWAVADGLTGTALGFGATREQALENWRAAVVDRLPWPEPRPAPEPLPEPEPGDGSIVIRGPEPDVTLPEPAPENVPAVLVPLAQPPVDSPGFGSWTGVLGERGATSFAARRRRARGFTLIGQQVLDVVDLDRLEAEIEREERQQEERFLEVLANSPGGGERRPCRTADYTVDGSGRLAFSGSSETSEWDAAGIDGDVSRAAGVRPSQPGWHLTRMS